MLGVAHQRMQEQPIDQLERALLQVFMRTMDRIAGLETDNGLPSPAFEFRARFGGRAMMAGEAAHIAIVEIADRARECVVSDLEQAGDARMVPVRRTIHKLGLAL